MKVEKLVKYATGWKWNKTLQARFFLKSLFLEEILKCHSHISILEDSANISECVYQILGI